MMMKNAIVLYPCSGLSHLAPMAEFGRFLLSHHPSFSVTVLVASLPSDAASTAAFIASFDAAPSITFHHLPSVSLSTAPSSFPALLYDFMTLNNNNLRQILESMSQTTSIKAFVIDFFCYTSSRVSAELNIPTYYLYTTGANGLANFLYFPTIDRQLTKSLKDDLDMRIHVPGTPPLLASDLPLGLLDRQKEIYRCFVDTGKQMAQSSGIIINTFTFLEQRAVEAISEGLCVPDAPTPPIFCIGPLVVNSDRTGGGRHEHECLNWLDTQPSRSVLFLSFGSMWVFSPEQLREIATALERSEVRFLWVVRTGTGTGTGKGEGGTEAPRQSLDSCWPEGFLERTKGRGYLVMSWVPQVAVLSHDSVGGFVTHCGWNSILESVSAGVPMLAWPLYAEQKMNRVVLVEELMLALPLSQSVVTATELENRVTELMVSENGKALRDRVAVMRDAAKAAMEEGGSSRVALAEWIESITRSS